MINLSTKEWQIKNIDTILFDKDGTFIDLHYFWGKMTELRVDEIIKIYNLDSQLFSKLCLNLGYDTQNHKMLKDGITALYSRPRIIEIFNKNLNKIGIKTTEKQLENIFDSVNYNFYNKINDYTKPIDSAIKFIKEMNNKGIKCGIVTSDSVESTQITLKHFKWEKYFQTIIGRESSKENKESGIPTQMALKILNSSPKNTVMIGDAPMDYLAANNAKIEKTILVATGQIEKKDLLLTSSYVVDTLDEIIY